MLNKGCHLDQAYFLHEYALPYSWKFLTLVQSAFKGHGFKVSGHLQTNLAKISHRLKDYEEREYRAGRKVKGQGVLVMSDMLCARVNVRELKDMEKAYQVL